MHELVDNIIVKVIALALHWVFYAIFDREKSKQKEKIVVQ